MSNQYVYGIHAVLALLANAYRPVSLIQVGQERHNPRLDEIIALAEQANIPVERCTTQALNQRFKDVNHQGVVALAAPLPSFSEPDLVRLFEASPKPCLILILDGVTDPHNLGACLRSADAAGVNFVVIPKDNNASMTPVVSKVACGAAEAVPLVRVTNLARSIETLKQCGVWVYGAAGEASESLYTLDCRSSMALVLGAEGKGMRRLTREQCDGLFSLPMQGSVTSLNVSVAAGVCLYEVVRQRMSLKPPQTA